MSDIIEPRTQPNADSDITKVTPMSLLIVVSSVLPIRPTVNRKIESAIGARK